MRFLQLLDKFLNWVYGGIFTIICNFHRFIYNTLYKWLHPLIVIVMSVLYLIWWYLLYNYIPKRVIPKLTSIKEKIILFWTESIPNNYPILNDLLICLKRLFWVNCRTSFYFTTMRRNFRTNVDEIYKDQPWLQIFVILYNRLANYFYTFKLFLNPSAIVTYIYTIVSWFYCKVIHTLRTLNKLIYVKDPETGEIINRLIYIRNRLTIFIVVMWFFSLFAGLEYFIPYFRSRLELLDEQNWFYKPELVFYKLYILLNPDNIIHIMCIILVESLTARGSFYHPGTFLNMRLQDHLSIFSGQYVSHHIQGYNYFVHYFFCKNIWPPFTHLIGDIQNGITTWFESNPLFFFFAILLFIAVVLSWLFLSYLGLYGVFFLNFIPLLLFWVSLCLSFESILLNNTTYNIKICSWVFLTNNTRLDYYFLIDSISFSFIFLTTTIALFVWVYAFSYFRYEPLVDRFLLFLVSFVISMLFLVSSGNTIMLFLGWELIGLTSFCLINFWVTKSATLKSAFKAFTFNKVSDFFMFMFLIVTYSVYYTFDILALNNQAFISSNSSVNILGFNFNSIELVCVFLLGAAFIKSAQFICHAWLPDSMEAPVPASSLIHSATLVSAGIYLILRFNIFIDMSVFAKFIIPIVGSLTAAYGGVSAIAQSDIKKTLAYSTISHCGFLMVLCSLEMNEYTLLYLYVHGFFKAGVFMCVGNVLRVTRGYQDTRRMGALFKYLPFEYFMMVIGLFNLAGLPFTFGFFVKHLLLVSIGKDIYIYSFVLFNCLVGAFAGLFYSYRILTYTFNDFKKAPKVTYSTWNNINSNSLYYTVTSKAATISIVGLYITAYVVCYLMFKYLVFNNLILNDFLNTTVLATYYSNNNSFVGYLLNFSFVNWVVVCILNYFLFTKYRRTEQYDNWILLTVYCVLLALLTFLFLY